MTGADKNSLSVFSLLDVLRRRKFWIVIPVILLTAGFAAFAYYQPNKYRATALIAAAQTTPPDYLRGVAPPPLNMQDHLWTVREVLFSPPVLQEAAKQTKRFASLKRDLSPQELDDFKQAITIKVDGEHTFQLVYEDNDAHDVMNVTNKLAQVFVDKASAKTEQKNTEAANVIDQQLNDLKQRMAEQSKKIHDYKTKTVEALPDHIDDNIRSIDATRDQILDRQTKIEEELAKKASIQQEIKDLESKGALDQPIIYEKDPDAEKLTDLKIKLNQLRTQYTENHPSVVSMKRQVADLENMIKSRPTKPVGQPSDTYLHYTQLKSELQAIDRRVDAYRRDQQDLRTQLSTYTARVQSTPQHEKVIEDLNRELNVGEMQFHALLDKQLDNKLAQGFDQSETGVAFSIIEPAPLPKEPYSPQRARLLLMGLAAGLGLGVALAFVLEQNDTTFGTVDEFQAFTTLPVAGVVPRIEARGKKKGRQPIVVVDDPESISAEQYRILAMKVQQQCESARAKTVLITSAAGGEGKSLTAINLALSLAATNGDRRVLLVDADMRKPRIAEYLKLLVPGDRGLYNLIVHGGAPEAYIDWFKNIAVMPGGMAQANPVVALSSPRARHLFDHLKDQFAYVIVDAPPVLPIADSQILAGLADKMLFVVRARQTPRELFVHAIEGFDPANVLGAVLNDVDYQRTRYAYAYEYYKKAA